MSDNRPSQLDDTSMLTGAYLTVVPTTNLDPARPSYITYDYKTPFGEPGLYYHNIKASKEGEDEKVDIRIRSPLRVVASMSSENLDSYGRLLKFTTSDRKLQEWFMPMRLLEGSGVGVQRELLDKAV